MAFAETVFAYRCSSSCSEAARPDQQARARCAANTRVRGEYVVTEQNVVISAHRLRKALHQSEEFNLVAQFEGFHKLWQPACSVPEQVLACYFATKSHERMAQRRELRLAFRKR